MCPAWLIAPGPSARPFRRRAHSRRPSRRSLAPSTAAHPSGLTRREREVSTLITRGMSDSEIERHLHLSRGTVKTHIGRLLTRLAARERAQLVIAGYESGLADR
ncbi:response regulator transcription factor [Micromonospora sp. C31]|uniref:response regulator transcription factor n=1 Tax=Micromonospora sp. C31 TaxID=2824876 RepID=UPI001B38CD58|nr:LuxR C-terminal-related transcriptional regulator [Micromonospora sp. C31]MBQ1074403.1 response regulator transcription factor [Micromonospora sp. C31]